VSTAATTDRAPLRAAPRIGAMMVGLMLGVSLAALDMTIVATSVRTIADDLGDAGLQASVTTAYLITSAITTPLYGRLSDVHGRKPMFLVAITIFVLGSLACAGAGSMSELAAFRAVQGLGAGGLFSLSVTMVGDAVAPRLRARYTGRLIAVYGLFGVLGPVLGGLLADSPELLGITGWRWVFALNVPIGALALLVVASVRLPRRRGHLRVDWWGALLLAGGLTPLLIVAEEGRNWGWGSYPALLCYTVGVGLLGAFLLVEQVMGDAALLPVQLVRLPTARLGGLAGVVVGFAMFGVISTLPLYLQIVGGSSPTGAGLLMLPMVAGIVVTTAVSARVIERTGRYRIWVLLGCSMMTLGLLGLSTLDADTPFPITAVCMVVFGIGLGANLQSLTLAVQNALPTADTGVATATTTFARQLGGSLGAAVCLSILFSAVPERITRAVADAAQTPQFRSVLTDPAVLAEPANRALAAGLQGSGDLGASILADSSFLGRLHPVLARPFQVGFAESLSPVFIVVAVVMVLGLLATLAMPDVVLRGADADHHRPSTATVPRMKLPHAPPPAIPAPHVHYSDPTMLFRPPAAPTRDRHHSGHPDVDPTVAGSGASASRFLE
jgi:EmrB/QacA subfamily drug resistance transporter